MFRRADAGINRVSKSKPLEVCSACNAGHGQPSLCITAVHETPDTNAQATACGNDEELLFFVLCVAAVGAEVVPPKVKVADVRDQLQKQLDEHTPRCLNDD